MKNSLEYHGIEIEPTYVSANGSGNICKTVQGYLYDSPSSSRDGKTWASSKKEAIRKIDRLRAGLEGRESIEKWMFCELLWIAERWPEESDLVKVEIRRRHQEAIEAAQKVVTARNEDLADCQAIHAALSFYLGQGVNEKGRHRVVRLLEKASVRCNEAAEDIHFALNELKAVAFEDPLEGLE